MCTSSVSHLIRPTVTKVEIESHRRYTIQLKIPLSLIPPLINSRVEFAASNVPGTWAPQVETAQPHVPDTFWGAFFFFGSFFGISFGLSSSFPLSSSLFLRFSRFSNTRAAFLDLLFPSPKYPVSGSYLSPNISRSCFLLSPTPLNTSPLLHLLS